MSSGLPSGAHHQNGSIGGPSHLSLLYKKPIKHTLFRVPDVDYLIKKPLRDRLFRALGSPCLAEVVKAGPGFKISLGAV